MPPIMASSQGCFSRPLWLDAGVIVVPPEPRLNGGGGVIVVPVASGTPVVPGCEIGRAACRSGTPLTITSGE